MARTLPGQRATVDENSMCDKHPEKVATNKLCVEADSFGEEYVNMCDHCWGEHEAALKRHESDPTQWEHCGECGKAAPHMVHYRDFEEGMNGPVYSHCPDCHQKYNNRIAAEYAGEDDDDDYSDSSDDYYHDTGPEEEEENQSFENLTEEDMKKAIAYFNSKFGLEFKVTTSGRGVQRLHAIIIGAFKYKKFVRKLKDFKEAHVQGGWLVGELHEEIIRRGDEISIDVSHGRTNGLPIKGSASDWLRRMREAAGTKTVEYKGKQKPEYHCTIHMECVYYH